MVIFVVGLVCLFGAGGLLEILGWQTMNLVLMPWLGLAAASLVWLGLTTDLGPHLGGEAFEEAKRQNQRICRQARGSLGHWHNALALPTPRKEKPPKNRNAVPLTI
ncbi:hypothetical protein [Pseudomonas indica]|uniref:hypothetical protein n=1 Tax=Pseudomonas indica TaxID=137658 RepID=UPI0023F953B1|nr:hypothetical protein [Pseudomonas indica]MBU3059567.1 hypothetical protein [Pseudomonas indica]